MLGLGKLMKKVERKRKVFEVTEQEWVLASSARFPLILDQLRFNEIVASYGEVKKTRLIYIF